MGSDTGYILEMNHITKEFPGVKALKDVTFKVRKGVVHGLMGENGAGKIHSYENPSGNLYTHIGDNDI